MLDHSPKTTEKVNGEPGFKLNAHFILGSFPGGQGGIDCFPDVPVDWAERGGVCSN